MTARARFALIGLALATTLVLAGMAAAGKGVRRR